MPTSVPSLKDYTNFHGMLCSVGTARRCIQSFNGVAIFADQSIYNDDNTDLSTVDYNKKGALLGLSVLNYYLLVLFSLTGACTLLGQTEFLESRDGLSEQFHLEQKDVTVRSKKIQNQLCMPSKVLEYIRASSAGGTENNLADPAASNMVVLKRRFEYNFGGCISVMMLHFECSRGKTHLVEVYRIERKSPFGLVVCILLKPLRLVGLWTRKRSGKSIEKIQ
jgi:hypothetical protein